MKKTFVWALILISLTALLLRFSSKWAETFLGIKQTSGISVLSQPQDAIVYLDNEEIGKTPVETKNLDVKTYTVKIQKDKASWERKIQLTAGTVTVVNRDLTVDSQTASGEILTLEKGKGITIVSNPTGADVEIDGKTLGKTPLVVDLESGEHTVLVSNTNYLKRSIRANLPAGFNLTISVDLALSEADLTTIATPTITQTPEVLVKQTPTGFLRVRDKPNLSGRELTQVKPGDVLVLLEEQGAWFRVRLSDGTEGFVSASYVEKQNP